MALKIISSKQSIEVKNITICIYAPPAYGKTSTAFTAKNPLLLDFDNGAYRSQFRKDTVQIESWQDITGLTEEDLKPYDTIIIDTVGRALDMITVDILRSNQKGTTRNGGTELSQQGYGTLKNRFISWLKLLRSFGKDVVLLSHMTEERKNDEFVERLDIQGGAKNEVYKVADLMGRLVLNGNQKVLDFNPSSTGFGKNPIGLPVIAVPNFKVEPLFLANIIEQVKAELNKQSDEAIKEQQELDEVHAKFSVLLNPEEFNEMIDPDMPTLHKQLLMDYAKKQGITFNKESKQFEKVAA
ncbi:ATP-binding protein [Gallibacterium genomosp. 1]|uniref:Uncharacterized protein n=1 Tax=Gallibacterium genomosp. 1 TaxID=155515 RepID=A0A0A2YHY0_9PAST|nr:ATP-binding protein [Gallibacterium genomosp. 1]KGQ36964.1 hypothetical protein JP36_07610 [Gallibacterium genomosp. 1]OBX00278.1 hypothetical protein QV04_06875 [Gallibacterium genomosp. 1]OBX00468.1 hypothetical protein QV05_07720 [Gallibacterium genomosp. 1]